MSEEAKVSKEYLEGFNQGYEVAKELGLKPNTIDGISAGGNRMQGMKDGMEQYGKELIEKRKEKDNDIIPSFDMDSINNNHIDLTPEKENRDKGKGLDM